MNPDLTVATQELGYVEQGGSDGKSGNITKYWAELQPSFQGQPWCAAFVMWVNKRAGTPNLPVSNPYYCPNLVTYAKKNGLWDASGKYSPSDLVFYDFSGSGVAEHIERVVSDDGTTIVAIGGNTSAGSSGSQANGGGVYRRNRPHGPTVLGVLKYSKLIGNTVPRTPVKTNPNTEGSVKWIQWAVGVPVDGVRGPQTNAAIKQFQKQHGLDTDGIVGPKTTAEMRKVTH